MYKNSAKDLPSICQFLFISEVQESWQMEHQLHKIVQDKHTQAHTSKTGKRTQIMWKKSWQTGKYTDTLNILFQDCFQQIYFCTFLY
jgi:hypothetical protein